MSSIRSLFSFAPPSAGGSETTAAVGGGVAVLYLRLRVFLYAGVAVLGAVTIPMGEAKGGFLVAAISGVLAVVATLTLIELLRRLGRPPFPIRAFSDEATAVRWLTAYLPPTETDAPTPSGHTVT